MTSRIYLLLCLLMCVAGCARRSYPSHDKDAGAPLFGGGGPASLPISFLVKPDAGTQQIVCSADGGCVYVECDAGEVFMRIDGSASRCTQITSGGSFPIVPSKIIFQPGGTTGGNVCATETCVATTVNAAPGPDVVVDCTYGVANLTSTSWNFGGYGALRSIGSTCILTVSGTGQLQNLLNFDGVEVVNNKTSGGPAITNALPGTPTITLSGNSEFVTGSTAAEPFWAISSGAMTVILQGASGFGTNKPTQAAIALTGSATLNVYAYQVPPAIPIIGSMVSGGGSTTLNFYGDETAFPLVAQSLFSGTLAQKPQSLTTGVNGLYYDASANVVGGSPLSIGTPPYTFSTGAQPIGIGEVLQITASGPTVKFAPLNGTTANSFVACDGGEVLTGRDGGAGMYCGSGGGGTYTGTAPIVVSGSVISISAATTSAAGSIKLANDLAGTGASPEVLYLANQSSIADTSGDLALGTTTIPADSQTKSLFLANGTTPSTTTTSGQWLTGVTDGAVHPGYTLNLTSDGFLTQIGTFGGASAVVGQGIAFGSADIGGGTLIGQASSTTKTTGSNLSIYAQGTTAASSTGGGVQIYAGSGSSATGQVFLGGTNSSFGSGASLTVNTTMSGVANGVTITSSSATPLTVTDSSSLTTSITGQAITNARFWLEPLIGSTSTDTALYLGPSGFTPTAGNYAVESNGTYTEVQAPSSGSGVLYLGAGNVSLLQMTATTSVDEVVSPTGVNWGIGSTAHAGADTGTNLLDLTHGTANTVCGGDVCLSGVSSGGLFALSQHGFATYLAPDLTGTVNTQHDTYSRPPVCVASLTSASTTTCTIPKIASTGLVITYRCMGRTTTAGATGSVGDTTAIVSMATEGVCSTTSGGTTTCQAGTTVLQNTGTANLTTCVLSSISNVPTVTLTAATDVGIAIDTSIQIEGLYN
jgi:hypothetical protein